MTRWFTTRWNFLEPLARKSWISLEKMSIYSSLVSSATLAQVQMFLHSKPKPSPKIQTTPTPTRHPTATKLPPNFHNSPNFPANCYQLPLLFQTEIVKKGCVPIENSIVPYSRSIFGDTRSEKHDKLQKIWKKCFHKEKSTVPNSRPKFAWPSLILNIRSKFSLEIYFSSESLRQGVYCISILGSKRSK